MCTSTHLQNFFSIDPYKAEIRTLPKKTEKYDIHIKMPHFSPGNIKNRSHHCFPTFSTFLRNSASFMRKCALCDFYWKKYFLVTRASVPLVHIEIISIYMPAVGYKVVYGGLREKTKDR